MAHRQAGIDVGRILGDAKAKPADQPIVPSTKFELVITPKTAKRCMSQLLHQRERRATSSVTPLSGA